MLFRSDQRLQVARTETFSNAKTVRDQLLAEQQIDPVRDLRTEGGGFALIVNGDRRFYSDVRYTLDDIPIELRTIIEQGGSGQQRFTLAGTPMVAVGITLPAVGAHYIEAFSLSSTERNLRAIVTALVVGAAVTTLVAGGLGWWTGRRLLSPLSRVSTAAGEIASGGLDARMPPEDDPDLARLARSFNDMADAVQTRIEREARFASDVSHELRSPITALAAAVEVLDSRRSELPERSQQALDVVVSQVRRFDHMVMDLLELSRIDAGSTELHREEVDLRDLVPRIAQRYGFSEVPVDTDDAVPTAARIDKLRFERVLANLQIGRAHV